MNDIAGPGACLGRGRSGIRQLCAVCALHPLPRNLHDHRHGILVANDSANVADTGRVFNQQNIPSAEVPHLAITHLEFAVTTEVEKELTCRRRMPLAVPSGGSSEEPVCLSRPELGRHYRLGGRGELHQAQRHCPVFEMRLAVLICEEAGVGDRISLMCRTLSHLIECHGSERGNCNQAQCPGSAEPLVCRISRRCTKGSHVLLFFRHM